MIAYKIQECVVKLPERTSLFGPRWRSGALQRPYFGAEPSLGPPPSTNYSSYLCDNRRECVYIQAEEGGSKITSEAYSENAEDQEKQEVLVYMPDPHLPIWL